MTRFDDTTSSRASADDALARAEHAALLVRTGAGDSRAFMALYELYAPRMFGLLLRILRDRGDAEDALQVALLEVWRKADSFDPSLGAADTWILMIARARGIDALRRRESAKSARAGARDPIEQARSTPDEHEGFREAIENLPEGQKTAVELSFYRGLTREKIAATLGLPVGTVKTRIRQGILTLARVLKDKEGAHDQR